MMSVANLQKLLAHTLYLHYFCVCVCVCICVWEFDAEDDMMGVANLQRRHALKPQDNSIEAVLTG